MSLGDRIREVRKDSKLSQTVFGEKLGVSRNVINDAENDRVPAKDLLINHICAIFHVSEEWLRTGDGEKFKPSDDSILSALSQKYRLGDMELSIVETFLNLPPDARATVTAFLKSLADPTASRIAHLRQKADAAIVDYETRMANRKADA